MPRSKAFGRIGGAMLAIAAITLIGGCSASNSTPDSMPQAANTPVSSPDSASTSEAAPEFSGPFADEYTEAWENASSDVVRMIIEDEVISDQEWATVKENLRQCLSDNGIELTSYDDKNGSYEARIGEQDGDTVNQFLGECEESSGEAWLARLYRSQTSNPNNIPDTQLLVDCLVRNGAVPSDYTEEDYLQDAPDFAFPYIVEDGDHIFVECNDDFSYNK